MIYCSRCGAAGELEPLEGTGHAFCPYCARVMRDMAEHLTSKGQSIEQILDNIQRRYAPTSPAK